MSKGKPFVETSRVTSPVRQSRASPPLAEKRLLRGVGRSPPRSVDTAIQRCGGCRGRKAGEGRLGGAGFTSGRRGGV